MVITTFDIEYLSSILRPNQGVDLVYRIEGRRRLYTKLVYWGFDKCSFGCKHCTLKYKMNVTKSGGKDRFCLDNDLIEILTEDVIKINKITEV